MWSRTRNVSCKASVPCGLEESPTGIVFPCRAAGLSSMETGFVSCRRGRRAWDPGSIITGLYRNCKEAQCLALRCNDLC